MSWRWGGARADFIDPGGCGHAWHDLGWAPTGDHDEIEDSAVAGEDRGIHDGVGMGRVGASPVISMTPRVTGVASG